MDIVSTIIPAVLPAIMDIVKSVFSSLLYKGRVLTVDDEIKLMQAETEKLKALAQLDEVKQPVSQWVNDVRAIFRYAFCFAILVVFLVFALSPETVDKEITATTADLVSGVTFFLIGHRSWLYIKNKR